MLGLVDQVIQSRSGHCKHMCGYQHALRQMTQCLCVYSS